jgi:hypothetical protein
MLLIKRISICRLNELIMIGEDTDQGAKCFSGSAG